MVYRLSAINGAIDPAGQQREQRKLTDAEKFVLHNPGELGKAPRPPKNSQKTPNGSTTAVGLRVARPANGYQSKRALATQAGLRATSATTEGTSVPSRLRTTPVKRLASSSAHNATGFRRRSMPGA